MVKLEMNSTGADLIVAGAGPAGIAAAIQARRLGLDVLVLDKAAFPREKLCGGLLTVKTMGLIASLCPALPAHELYEVESRKVSLYHKAKHITTVEPRYPYYLTERRDFDHRLVNYYLAIGGRMRRAKVKSIDTDTRRVGTDAGQLSYTYLVVADGANSPLRRSIWPGFRPGGFCLESDAPVAERQWENHIRILFGNLDEGYSWLFPKTGRYTLGTGWRKRGGHDFQGLFDGLPGLLDMPGLDLPRPKGAFIPTGRYMRKPFYGGHILFAGDAAGLVDPITGEGIYMALESGRMAARAVHECINKGHAHAGKLYLKKLNGIHHIIRKARMYQRIVYLPFVQKIYFRLLKGRTGFMSYYLDEIMSTYQLTYSNVVWRYLGRRFFGPKPNDKRGSRVS